MGLSEILLIGIVCVVVLKPADWRALIKTFKQIFSYINKLKQEIFSHEEEEQTIEEQEQLNVYLSKVIEMSGKYEGKYDLPSVKAYYHKLLIKTHTEAVAQSRKIKDD